MKAADHTWEPLQEELLAEIEHLFSQLFPVNRYGTLAAEITAYWLAMLRSVWKAKSPVLKKKDEAYNPRDPLSRIQQKTVVIAYADSVRTPGEASLETLDRFLGEHFPAIGGLHLLPACRVVASRFNDGYFSQVVRDGIHPAFGTNQKFAEMMSRYYAMADFVLNHVDIENPDFQAYLAGDDARGDCFYVFSEEAYQRRLRRGDFNRIFRPRPFPLFSIFRRTPADSAAAALDPDGRVARMKTQMDGTLPDPVIGLLSIFNKLKNDQMLLDEDYCVVIAFREYLAGREAVSPDDIFTVSGTQETRRVPYIFRDPINAPADLLAALGYSPENARKIAGRFARHAPGIFGEEIRALTTFSHVQVDLNTATLAGLERLADDFAWYLGMDLDMLRLDAANFAFKRWGTSCFGLPEVKGLMKVLTLSMDCVAPRMAANLEVNDTLSSVLAQMANQDAPPPMMYDFHLAGMLPAAFITVNARIFDRIFTKIAGYTLPADSIRFSLAESHDGKSVRGSLDLLTLAERQALADTVLQNGGRIKYKGVALRRCSVAEFREVCREAGLAYESARKIIFTEEDGPEEVLELDKAISDAAGLAAALDLPLARFTERGPLKYFCSKIFDGREPYELCVATRDCLPKVGDPRLAVEQYLAFYTLAFALMGRNVKSVYFNDLLGLPNDHARMAATGELRDLKRSKSNPEALAGQLGDPASPLHAIATGMNNLIALVDADPALGPRGREAAVSTTAGYPESVAVVHCSSDVHTLIIVNVSRNREFLDIVPAKFGLVPNRPLFENIGGGFMTPDPDGTLPLHLEPFGRLWLTDEKIDIQAELLVALSRP